MMGDSENRQSPQARNRSRLEPHVYETSLLSIHQERAKYSGCLVGYLLDYRALSTRDLQDAIDRHWHLEGNITVMDKAGPYYIFKLDSLADRDDLLHEGPWNINGALILFRAWQPDLSFHLIDFSMEEMWIQIRGAPLKYMTPAMAVRLGSLLGTVISVDGSTFSHQNLNYLRVRVAIPIFKPLIPGAFLGFEDGDLVWIQFGYERVFKMCFNCGRVGHMMYRWSLSVPQAGIIIRERIHEVHQIPNVAFWIAEVRPLYTRAIKAYTNSNLNRTTNSEILWSQAEQRHVIEMVNGFGARTIFFVRNNLSSSSNFDFIEPFEGRTEGNGPDGTPTVSLNPMDEEAEYLDAVMVEEQNDNLLDHINCETNRSGSHSFRLDADFVIELNSLGPTADPSTRFHSKRVGDNLDNTSPKRPKYWELGQTSHEQMSSNSIEPGCDKDSSGRSNGNLAEPFKPFNVVAIEENEVLGDDMSEGVTNTTLEENAEFFKAENKRFGANWFGLDSHFEYELNNLGLTSFSISYLSRRKRSVDDNAGACSKRSKTDVHATYINGSDHLIGTLFVSNLEAAENDSNGQFRGPEDMSARGSSQELGSGLTSINSLDFLYGQVAKPSGTQMSSNLRKRKCTFENSNVSDSSEGMALSVLNGALRGVGFSGMSIIKVLITFPISSMDFCIATMFTLISSISFRPAITGLETRTAIGIKSGTRVSTRSGFTDQDGINTSFSNAGLVTNAISMDSSSAQSNTRGDEPCLLYDISVGVVSEEAEEFYKISSAEVIENIVDDFLQLLMMEKLNEGKKCRASLKFYNYSYGAINQCKFNIISIFHDTTEAMTNAPHNPLLLPPTTPTKKAKIGSYAGTSSPTNSQKEVSDESAEMQDESDDEDTCSLSKKKKCINARASSFLGGQNLANHLPTTVSYLIQADNY
ncbi:hypothetical protein Vadar_004155 [Vaccinium darrowii]|uniref:Uncharacterized protein n=1 Tax=Vaccinium darrowii TaxID=229202 RepID=A0ACB7YBC8_9ERIC|nr:hypothetical protein Vadar_004155 [Vaccinium darrowii]